MRTVFLLPLLVVLTAVVGCESEGREQAAASVTGREITLLTPAPEVEIASPLELRRPQTHQTVRRSRSTSRPAQALRHATVEPKLTLAIVVTPPLTVGPPTSVAPEPVSDRELPPGRSVTVIPASSGPSAAPDYIDEFPPTRSGTIVRGGGRCPPRNRPGIGIATRPRPSLY
jgi:hypothetical protein